MEPQNRVRAFLYLDDGQPESREYDSNYLPLDTTPLDQPAPRHWLSVLFRLRAWREAEADGRHGEPQECDHRQQRRPA